MKEEDCQGESVVAGDDAWQREHQERQAPWTANHTFTLPHHTLRGHFPFVEKISMWCCHGPFGLFTGSKVGQEGNE